MYLVRLFSNTNMKKEDLILPVKPQWSGRQTEGRMLPYSTNVSAPVRCAEAPTGHFPCEQTTWYPVVGFMAWKVKVCSPGPIPGKTAQCPTFSTISWGRFWLAVLSERMLRAFTWDYSFFIPCREPVLSTTSLCFLFCLHAIQHLCPQLMAQINRN